MDSALLFKEKYLQLNAEILGYASREYLNIVCIETEETEDFFGLDAADKFYKHALDVRAKLYGNFSKKIIAAIDSIFRLDTNRSQGFNNAFSRFAIYSTFETDIALDSLDTLSLKHMEESTTWNSVIYARQMMDEYLKLESDSSDRFIKGMYRLGMGFNRNHYVKEIAIYCLRTCIEIMESKNKEHSTFYQQLLFELADIYVKNSYTRNDVSMYKKMQFYADKMLNTCRKYEGVVSEKYADALCDYAQLLTSNVMILRNDKLITNTMHQALQIIDSLYGQQSEKYGRVLEKLAGRFTNLALLDSAEITYLKANSILKNYNSVSQNIQLYFLISNLYNYME
jgi:hypothetical protein